MSLPLLVIDAKRGTVNRYVRKPGGVGFFRDRTEIEPEHLQNLGDDVHLAGLQAFRQTPNSIPSDDVIERDEA